MPVRAGRPDGDEPGNQLQIKTLKGIVWPDAVTNDEGRTTVNPRSNRERRSRSQSCRRGTSL